MAKGGFIRPMGKDFLCQRTENAHSSNDVMYCVLLDSGSRIEHLKDTGNVSPVYSARVTEERSLGVLDLLESFGDYGSWRKGVH